MPTLSDLVRRAQGGDLEAFSTIVRRFQDMAIAYAYARIGNRGLAEDIAQESWVEAFRHLNQLRDPERFPSWLKAILFKHADRVRRKRQLPTASLDRITVRGASSPDASESYTANEKRARVLREVRGLPEALRIAIVLFYAGGHSVDEIAHFTEEPVGTIKRRLHDARTNLKERMLDMVKDALEELRPSRSPDFMERVARLLKAVAKNEGGEAMKLVDDDPELATEPGPHPMWGESLSRFK